MGEERATPGFIPCLWCARPISLVRLLGAAQACTIPLYCGDDCRFDLERSLVKRIYEASETAAEEAGFADFAEFEAATRANFMARLRSATSPGGVPAAARRAISGALEEPAVQLLK